MYPMLYDEQFHFGVIKVYEQQLSPIIRDQQPKYDVFGNLANGDATLFHLILSFPSRFISKYIDSLAIQIIAMRFLCIGLFSLGIILFRKLLLMLGVKRGSINVSLLIFVLIPVVPFLAATVNYDNMLFPLTALFFIYMVKILAQDRIQLVSLIGFLSIGMFASLVKYIFLPIFFAGIVVVMSSLLFKYRRKRNISIICTDAKASLKSKRHYEVALIVLLFCTTLFLFTNKFIKNTIQYGTPQPSCQQTFPVERCRANYVANRAIDSLETKSQRKSVQLPDYSSEWFRQMVRASVLSASNTTESKHEVGRPLSIIYVSVFFGAITLPIVIAIGFAKYGRKYKPLTIVTCVALFFTGVVYLQNVLIYYEFNAPYAIQARYLVNIWPILLAFAVMTVDLLLGRRQSIKAALVAAIFLIMLQGGGMSTYLLSANQSWYWNNETVRNFNESMQNYIDNFVVD